jgi:hypothetical protein
MTALLPLVPLAHGFAAWPIVELRSAGFSHRRLAPFVDEKASALAREIIALEKTADDARRTLVHAILDKRRAAAHDDERARLARDKRAVEKGGLPALVDDETAPRARALAGAREALDTAVLRLLARASEMQPRFVQHLVDEATDERFTRAVLWQNRGAVNGSLAALARHANDGQIRAKDVSLALSYLTRYATKNDTVAFMGPVGWARFVDDDRPLTSTPGPHAMLKRFDVHFEPWAMVALADALAARVHRHLVPTVNPRVLVEGDTVSGVPSRRLDGRSPLSAAECAVLARVDGALPMSAFTDDEAVTSTLDELMKKRIVRARLPVTTSVSPEISLVHALEQMADDDGVRAARAACARLVAAKGTVVAAQESAAALSSALHTLDQVFAEETGGLAVRNAGRTYGSRTLLYANASRDVDVTLGRPLIAQIARPLSLLARVARAFSVDAARRFLTILDATHASVAARRRESRAPCTLVYERLVALFREPPPQFLRDARADIAERVRALYGDFDTEAREVRFSSDLLAPVVDALFPERAPGYPGARHHSPDILVRQHKGGALSCVLGEIHAGTNTLAVQQAIDQSDDPALLRALFRRDLPDPQFIEIQHEDFGLCAHDSLLDRTDVHLDTGSRFSSWLGDDRVIPLSCLFLERAGEFLHVVDTEGYFVGDALQVFERILRLNATTEFHLPIATPHQPRVSFDDMVVQRETWSLASDDVDPLCQARGAERTVAIERLRERFGWPRHLFVRVPAEKKPLYLDCESPLIVDTVCRALEGAPTVTVSEMLPALDETWLTDAAGEPFVSELRIVVVDPEPWSPLPVPSEVTS